MSASRCKDLSLCAGEDIALNSHVFTVCSASISPDPPDEPAAVPRRPVVLSSSTTLMRKRPLSTLNGNGGASSASGDARSKQNRAIFCSS